ESRHFLGLARTLQRIVAHPLGLDLSWCLAAVRRHARHHHVPPFSTNRARIDAIDQDAVRGTFIGQGFRHVHERGIGTTPSEVRRIWLATSTANNIDNPSAPLALPHGKDLARQAYVAKDFERPIDLPICVTFREERSRPDGTGVVDENVHLAEPPEGL